MVQVVDHGKTLLFTASRTKTRHENHMYQDKLYKFIIKDLAEEMSKYGAFYDVMASAVYAPKVVKTTTTHGLPVMFWRVMFSNINSQSKCIIKAKYFTATPSSS